MRVLLKITLFTLVLSLLLCGCRNTSQENKNSSSTNTSITEPNKDVVVPQKEQIESSSSYSTSSKNPVSSAQNSSSVVSQAKPKPQKTVKTKGIDVSKWQGRIDWKAVKSSGFDFAVIRIGYRGENGKIFKDDCADYNIQQAIKNNILVGVYFFSTAVSETEAVKEAKWTVEAVKSYPISYPIVYDCEGYEKTDSRMYSLTKAERTDNAVAFLSEIKSSGYDGMFYSSATEMTDSRNWDMARIENDYKVWVAYYPATAYPGVKFPVYSGEYDMWQYTNSGTVSGVDGKTDMIVSYFSAKKGTAKSSQKPPVASVPEIKDDTYTAVNDTVTAKDLVNLRDSDSTKGNIVATLKNGETLKRTATGSNGWSKLTYNGKTVYAVTSYLTTDLEYKTPQEDDGFKKVDEKVTAKSITNLRSVPSSSDASTVVYTLKNGEIAKRIGISDSGWSKVTYKGKTLYAVTSYLTTDLKYKPPVESNNQTTNDVGMQFENVYEQVTAKSETNLRSEPSSKDADTIVYTLKNGEYITRTGVSSSGWSRLLYKGETVYAISSYLVSK